MGLECPCKTRRLPTLEDPNFEHPAFLPSIGKPIQPKRPTNKQELHRFGFDTRTRINPTNKGLCSSKSK